MKILFSLLAPKSILKRSSLNKLESPNTSSGIRAFILSVLFSEKTINNKWGFLQLN